ncbi:adenylate kinase 7-like [Aplochiton taeniatus]
MECDVVVYNLSEYVTPEQLEQATWAITTLNAQMDSFKSQKIFILISTVMTWAMSKPLDQEDPEAVMTEDDFRRKRPPNNFKENSNLEKLVLKLGKTKKAKLVGYVVAAGIQYGMGENMFHYFFKTSWLVEFPRIPVFGQGTNIIPMVHVNDLAGVIQNVIDHKPKAHFFLAVDDSRSPFEDIVKAISIVLGSGKTKKVQKEEAYQTNAMSPTTLEYLSINLRLEAVLTKDTFNIRWVSESGIIQNIHQIVNEYKVERRLLPIKICLLGPPAVGKTTIAEKLCKHYRLNHVMQQGVIEEKIALLGIIANGADPENNSEDAIASAQEQLEHLKISISQNEGQLDEQSILHLLRGKLSSKPCRNQGYVLDGFPKSYEQARELFYEESEFDDPKPKIRPYNKKIIPDYILSLKATEDFLIKRVQDLPQSVAEEMGYTQEEFLLGLARYRQNSSGDETVLGYFDDLEIHPEHIKIQTSDPEYAAVMEKITTLVGQPSNYGPTPEEKKEQDRKLTEEKQRRLAQEAAERKDVEAAALAQLTAQMTEWNKNMTEVKKQEYELLKARSLPLRNYLMKYVMPTFSQAMIECCKVKPEDPIDFLSEFLLRNDSEEK